MNIGIPREKRPFEYRVGLSPAGVEILTQKQNQVYVEHEAGIGAGFSDQEYEKPGRVSSIRLKKSSCVLTCCLRLVVP